MRMAQEPASVGLKRKRSASVLGTAKKQVLQEDDSYSDESDDSTAEDVTLSSSQATPATTPGTPRTPSARPKCYHCEYEGCGKSFTRPSRLEEHIRSHTQERPFKCPHNSCGKSFLRDNHLSHHIKSAHTTVRDHRCDWPGCGKSFATGTRLRRHRARHEEKEQFRCIGFPPCNEIFRRHTTLQRHVVSAHMHQKPFPCTYIDEETAEPCPAGFDTLTRLKAHTRRIHTKDRFLCTLCSQDAGGDSHMTMTGTTEDGDTISTDSLANLSLVPVSFRTAAALREHMDTVHPPVCQICNILYSTRIELGNHVETAHSGTPLASRQTIPCPYEDCSRAFTRQGNLKVHIRTVHEGRKIFVCRTEDVSGSPHVREWTGEDACGNSFTTKANLVEHVRIKHLGLESRLKARRRAKRMQQATTAPNGAIDQNTPSALDMVTGVEYIDEPGRPIPCVVRGCPRHFRRDYDLKLHLRLSSHGMAETEIADALIERDMLSGGQFWIGGDDANDFADYEANLALDHEMGIQDEHAGYHIAHGTLPRNDGQWHFDELDNMDLEGMEE